jgi:chromosome segregation ATPase
MSAFLDLDDVVAGNPVAEKELAELVTDVETSHEALANDTAYIAELKAELDSETKWACDYSEQVEKLTHELDEARKVMMSALVDLETPEEVDMWVASAFRKLAAYCHPNTTPKDVTK